MFGGQDGLRRLMSQETLKPRNLGETLRRFGHYFTPFWPILLALAVLVIVSTWTQVTTPELIGQVVDCYLAPAGASTQAQGAAFPGVAPSQSAGAACWLADPAQISGVTRSAVSAILGAVGWQTPDPQGMDSAARADGMGRLILVIALLFSGGAVLTGMTFMLMNWAGAHVLRAMRLDVFRHFHRLSLGFYAEREAGDLMSRVTNDSETIQQAVNFALINVLGGALLLVWIAYNMLARSLPFALLSLIVVPAMAVITTWFSGQARKAFRRTRQEMGSVNAELQESIASVREVQAFNRAEENILNFRQTNAANRDANIRAVAYTSALAPTLEALSYLALGIVTGVGGWVLLGGQDFFGAAVSLGLVITFLGYVQRFNQPIQQIAVLWTNLQSAIAGGERIFDLLDVKPEIVDAPNAVQLPPIVGEVQFEDVFAAYKKDESVLNGLNFTAEAGQTIAIVGPTGAGKTTLINLIPRFYDVTSGVVRIDGRDVRSVTGESLRRQIGIVLQDTFLFSTTVMENIRFGRLEASDDEVIAAAKLAHAHEFIERLPEGYQTVLGERGSGLSQGQRQLLAIARAALADPRILILDEATSSVDTRTERLIQRALEGLLKGRTSFVIAHRLSTIRNADLVLVLDKGQIVECGKHDELLAAQGFYYNLYMSQFRQAAGVPGQPAPGGNGRVEANPAYSA
jgi:ATP-binding cassette subfamily B protein